jgi:TonB-dependent starch-binding outer membrane protein SusC
MKTDGTFHINIWVVVCKIMRYAIGILTVTGIGNRRLTHKIKITALLIPFLLLVTISAFSQITISKTNVSLEEVFFDITRQAGYNIIFKEEQIQKAGKVTINVFNASVTSVLDLLVKQQAFRYSIADRIVTIEFGVSSLDPNSPPKFVVIGKVTDPSGNPLAGTSVRIKNGIGGVTVDSNGDFVLNDINPASTLEFSHVGYDTRMVKLNNQKNLSITLSRQVRSLEEVVTNGYTSTIRKYEVGSIKKIVFDDIPQQVGGNLFAAIQGRIPGMIITQQSGLPGSPYRVQLRGQRSIGIAANGQLPNNAPLFIVDGVPFLSSSESIAQKGGILTNNPFSTLNPNDIESIEVLKDANATSIYGSLGANGVVLITTKKPKVGTASLSMNFNTGFSTITRAPDFMDTKEYLAMRREAFKNDGEIPDQVNAYDLLTWDNNRYNDWKDLLIGGTARVNSAHLRFSGGSQNTQFVVSGGYNKETTVFPSDHGKSFSSTGINFSHNSPNKKLDLTISASYGYDRNKMIARDPTEGIYYSPNAPNPLKEDGRLNFGAPGEYPFSNNPFANFHQPYNITTERLTTGLRVAYKILPKLSLRTNAGYNLITCEELYQLPIASLDPLFSPTGSASFGNSKNRNWILEPQAEYKDSIGNGDFRILVGGSMRSRSAIADLLNGDNYVNDAGLNSINNAGTITALYDNNQYRVISGYAMVNYNFHDKYILEITGRRDGSSRFGPNRKFGTFGSIGTGWIFSNEKLMNKLFPVFSFGKLRFTYGSSGNDQIGDYQFLDAWITNPRYPYQNPTIMPSRLADQDYRWEIQKSFDIGLDLGFYKNRFMLSATFNQSRTSNQLAAVTLPVQTGFNKVVRNYPAVTQNRNLELELTSNNIRTRNWKWNTSINFSILKNKLLKFPDLMNTDYGTNRFVIGKPLNIVWGYRTGELDKNTGVYSILDKDGKPIAIPGTLPSIADQVVLGTYDPKFFGGMENTIEWKKWKFQFLFQFVKQMAPHPIFGNDKAPGLIINQPRSVLDRWVSQGDNARYPKYTQSGNSMAYISWYSLNTSDLAFTDASFIRLKNISLTYSLPPDWFRKLKLKNCSIYLLGQNILTFTKFPGNDPETWQSIFSLPPLKTFAAGIQVSF